MQVTIDLLDDVAGEIAGSNGADLPRTVLEAVALEGYRAGTLTHAQVGQLLGIDYRFEVDAFLKKHGAYLDYTSADLDQDLCNLRDCCWAQFRSLRRMPHVASKC